MRVFLAAVLVLGASALCGACDDKKSVTERVQALQKQFQEDQQALGKRYGETKDEKEKEKIVAEARAGGAARARRR